MTDVSRETKQASYFGFTGHRDCHTTIAALFRVYHSNPTAIWVHGGASGFDAQVNIFAIRHDITVIVILPDYTTLEPREALLARDRAIVRRSDVLYACYDGRWGGGTYYTIHQAHRCNKPIIGLPCYKISQH